MNAKTSKEYTEYNIADDELWIPNHGVCKEYLLGYYRSMSWLYPVYQKIVKFMSNNSEVKLDPYSKMLLHQQYIKCESTISCGHDVNLLFNEIVGWIKIYNEKILM